MSAGSDCPPAQSVNYGVPRGCPSRSSVIAAQDRERIAFSDALGANKPVSIWRALTRCRAVPESEGPNPPDRKITQSCAVQVERLSGLLSSKGSPCV